MFLKILFWLMKIWFNINYNWWTFQFTLGQLTNDSNWCCKWWWQLGDSHLTVIQLNFMLSFIWNTNQNIVSYSNKNIPTNCRSFIVSSKNLTINITKMYKHSSDKFKTSSFTLFRFKLNQNKTNYNFSHWKSLTIFYFCKIIFFKFRKTRN